MPKRLRVAVLFGGRSGEHEVSIVSAQSVMAALDPEKYEVIPIGIAKTGQWLAGPGAVQALREGTELPPTLLAALPADPSKRELVPLGASTLPVAVQGQIDLVFPVLHGTYGEDGTVQGLLELANVPYVGAGVLGSACGMDKVVMKALFQQAGLPIAPYVWFLMGEWAERQAVLMKRIEVELGYPCFVKPANMGSSVGISKAHNQAELLAAVALAGRFDRKIVVEQAVPQAREIEVAVLGNDHPQASVPGEIVPSNEFYDYDAKYVDGKSQSAIPADLAPAVAEQIRNYATQAFKAVDCQGMGRVDLLLSRTTGAIYVNEINTIPGFTSISMYPKLWAASGLAYPKLLDRLIDLAMERWQAKQNLATSYQPKSEWHRG